MADRSQSDSTPLESVIAHRVAEWSKHPPVDHVDSVLIAPANRYYALFETNRDAIAYVHLDGHILEANLSYQRMLGYTVDELRKLRYQDITPEKWLAFEEEVIVPQIRERGYSDEYEKEYIRKDGTIFPVSIRSWRLHDERGEPLMCGIVRDISERKRVDALFAQSQRRLALHVERTPLPVIEWDLAGRIVAWNEAAERTFRVSREHAIGCHLGNLLFDAHGFDELLRASAHAHVGNAPICLENRTGDGRRVMCDWFVTPLFDANQTLIGAAALAMDVTDRFRKEEDQRNLERKLQQTQKLESLGVLAGGIAHDFNNLLTAILGNASLAERELAPTMLARSHLHSIQEASMRAAELCQQMLAYSGRGKFSVQRVSINTLIEETTRLLEVSIAKNVLLRFNLAPKLPGVDADPAQLRQVIMNLVLNASEAMGDRSGAVTLTTGMMRADRTYLTETYLSPDLPEGDYIYLEVADTGVGMTEEVRARIFDPFFTTKFTGRGLGLAVVLGIVRGHRGALKVYTEPSRGTTVKLLIPCAEGPELEYARSADPVTAKRLTGTALVVDDEETVRTVSARMLESLGMRTLIARDGVDGLRVFRENADLISLVLLDLTMPHMDGAETYRELRRVKPEVSVIVMSGFNENEAREQFAGKRIAGFLQKPFKLEDLSRCIATATSDTSE
jgi:PAS domain S-box-containing protein